MEEHDFEIDKLGEREEAGSGKGRSPGNARSAVTKAADASGFVPWEEDDLPSAQGLTVANKTIIKKSSVRQGTPLMIVPELPSRINQPPMEVQPLLEEGAIVGMKVTCSCGNSHEVRFEFDA